MDPEWVANARCVTEGKLLEEGTADCKSGVGKFKHFPLTCMVVSLFIGVYILFCRHAFLPSFYYNFFDWKLFQKKSFWRSFRKGGGYIYILFSPSWCVENKV
ncbi:UNVERIFIED_CONTAM: hypothetical protein K2H54_027379, partial [Gekko kuhli]